jgi:hypothetical protein
MYEKYKDKGFIVIQLKAQNSSSQTPSQADLESWADNFGITFPVLADSNWTVMRRWEQDNYIPSHTLLAPGMKVVKVDEKVSDADVEAILPD